METVPVRSAAEGRPAESPGVPRRDFIGAEVLDPVINEALRRVRAQRLLERAR